MPFQQTVVEVSDDDIVFAINLVPGWVLEMCKIIMANNEIKLTKY